MLWLMHLLKEINQLVFPNCLGFESLCPKPAQGGNLVREKLFVEKWSKGQPFKFDYKSYKAKFRKPSTTVDLGVRSQESHL